MTKIYSTIDDYIDEVVAPAIASCDLDEDTTRDQLLAIAHTMTHWHDEYTADFTEINVTQSGYIDRYAGDEDHADKFWGAVWAALYEI